MSDDVEPDADKMPADEQLEEPSTEKDPGEEPKAAEPEPEEVDHEAVGIGVVDTPDVGEEAPGGQDATPQSEPGGPSSDSAPPTDAASDEVKSDAAGIDTPE
ncbi:hypothetical protein GCM10022286_30770 [Gryllotalpicola daejeonensis]|uniref:Sugar ABC transporter ATPase n=1 Tax=Gryllotalpicola daejeonensis TaxID=993087 RepID=A0ABP7ZNN7_9MICO